MSFFYDLSEALVPTELWRDFLYTFVDEVLYLAKFVFECVTLQIKYPFAGYFRRLP